MSNSEYTVTEAEVKARMVEEIRLFVAASVRLVRANQDMLQICRRAGIPVTSMSVEPEAKELVRELYELYGELGAAGLMIAYQVTALAGPGGAK